MPNGNYVLSHREAVQMPASVTGKRGLGREAQAALLRVRAGLNTARAAAAAAAKSLQQSEVT